MNKFVFIITYPIRLVALGLIYFYKFCISPLLPANKCRFYPTCSTYMVLAIKEWGVFKGIILGTRRIVRCNPRGKCGLDLVPYNIKGDKKWIF